MPGATRSVLAPSSDALLLLVASCRGNVLSDPNPAERKTPVGDGRVARVLLDPAQYHQATAFIASFREFIFP